MKPNIKKAKSTEVKDILYSLNIRVYASHGGYEGSCKWVYYTYDEKFSLDMELPRAFSPGAEYKSHREEAISYFGKEGYKEAKSELKKKLREAMKKELEVYTAVVTIYNSPYLQFARIFNNSLGMHDKKVIKELHWKFRSLDVKNIDFYHINRAIELIDG